jgi:phage terminase small subunit
MSRGLTKKQKIFVKEYVKTGHGTKSALKAYDTKDYSTADSIAVENLQKAAIRKAIADRLPDDLLEEKHLALLNKMERDYDSEGNLIAEDIDVQAVSKGLDMAYKVKGSYAPEKKDINIQGNIDVKDKKAIELGNKYEEELKLSLNGETA